MGKRGGLWVNEMDLPSSIIFHLMIESGGLKFPWSLHIIFFSHQREDTFDHVFIIGFFSSMTWIKTLGYLVFTTWRMNHGKLKSIDGLFIQNS